MCTRSPLGPGHYTFAVVAIRAWPRGNYRVIEPWTEFIVAASSGGALSFVVSDIPGGIVPFVRVGVCFFQVKSNYASVRICYIDGDQGLRRRMSGKGKVYSIRTNHVTPHSEDDTHSPVGPAPKSLLYPRMHSGRETG